MGRKGDWLYLSGVLLALGSVLLGNSLQSELRTLPIEQLMLARGPESLRVLGFAFGFPLGIGLSILGALLGSESSLRRLLLFTGMVTSAVLAAILVPGLFGRELGDGYFGTGGYLIMALVLGLIWLWGRYRTTVARAVRNGVDLQGMGYLCFALAAWNLCGAATMPSFGLEPEMMLTMGSQAFAIGQMKSIMALFVLGWLCSLLGWWITLRGAKSAQVVTE
ncbi:MAG: hypothetical protein QNJ78_00920 [Gammaproteobacteria bacterium]|nr:hypothetical protein [Gammaproteobacteria bacterium]